ncbi:MAG: hypothetical protein JWP75_2389 [Frondihabitans sp.]|nr:hypothetical protein [Frondihabitans sp.]
MSTTAIPLTAHETFVLERDYPVPPARVYDAFATVEGRRAWFAPSEDGRVYDYSLDFREGGAEHLEGDHGDQRFTYDAVFQNLVPDKRIVYSYDMHFDGVKISFSMATVELLPTDDGASTHLKLTEHGAYFENLDRPTERPEGTESLLDALGRSLA